MTTAYLQGLAAAAVSAEGESCEHKEPHEEKDYDGDKHKKLGRIFEPLHDAFGGTLGLAVVVIIGVIVTHAELRVGVRVHALVQPNLVAFSREVAVIAKIPPADMMPP
eukprot:CAMPEP_0173384362 /NCGR_PEP_ID=MMETSP1356-20130122/6950_1 /TAXON_ID=77927 ORGANISM="Hemiselmis virescens, Strain PCC157" /NCGR_SAMPLE_ID=MMETSP1356 /ASSEMBLY_ACC=CAM_ASM_000847 /LENGTH=107 /DNA_ID=CAMNT_0014339687 /DNA_START=80 /DNA_END=400 /DNA_ORIENTATION=-